MAGAPASHRIWPLEMEEAAQSMRLAHKTFHLAPSPFAISGTQQDISAFHAGGGSPTPSATLACLASTRRPPSGLERCSPLAYSNLFCCIHLSPVSSGCSVLPIPARSIPPANQHRGKGTSALFCPILTVCLCYLRLTARISRQLWGQGVFPPLCPGQWVGAVALAQASVIYSRC
jgi:hypothetical protein